jgi:dTMP kinase
MFLTVEGVEGAGKSTFIGLLENELTKRGISFMRTREPGG